MFSQSARRHLALWSFAVLLMGPRVALASTESVYPPSPLQQAENHLDAWRVTEAEETVTRLLREDPKSIKALDLKTKIAFYKGRYDEALEAVEQALAIESGAEKRQAWRLFIQRTLDSVKGLERYESDHFVILLDRDRDSIMASHALKTLEKSYEILGRELGYLPQTKVRVEIAPDVSSFNAISTLSLRDIEETGAVGICKFNKVMMISPRVLMHGYRWLDSLSHEYLHYVIVGLSANQAPIWLHEGMARFYETLWRDRGPLQKPDYLTPSNETLLARALEENQFVGFKKMEPSLIHLETPEQVQLAYAEAASAIDFIVAQQGSAAVKRLLSELRENSTADALERALGIPFEQFQAQWQTFLKGKGLKKIKGSRVRRLKAKGKGGTEETVELREIQSAVARNRTHLADRLRSRNRTAAAIREYQRALRASPHSTIILNRLGRALNQRSRHEEALPYLKKAQTLDPDFVGTYIELGRLYQATKDYGLARNALEEAIQINPFDPTIHQILYRIHLNSGDRELAKESKETFEKLVGRR